MTSATTPAPPAQLNATAAAAPSSTSGTTTPSAAVPAQQPTRSYASAATKSVQDNGKASPVNGAKTNNSSSQPASSSTTTAMQNGDHGRKPSVIISASGTSGQIPNGAPVGQSSRPNINFGSINGPSGSPAIASSAPHPPQTPALNAPRDPRVTSPTHSPSPIPQPAASGGKPPSTLPGQSNGLSFGSMGADNGDANRGPQAPLTPGQQTAHLRRESSHSAHSDMSMRGGFAAPNGRGRGYSMPYAPGSPAQGYRQLPNQGRGPPNMPPYTQNPAMGFSPGRGRGGSPMMMAAQPFVPGQPQMHGGYHQHLNPQQQAFYGGQPPYDPQYGFYQPYYPQQQFQQHGAPSSPRPSFPVPYGGPPQHMPNFHPMSRSGSQISERPSSSVGQPAAAAAAAAVAAVAVAAPNTAPSAPSTPVPASSAFQIPVKKASKAIVIKNDKGEEVTFEKKASPAPSVVASSPAIVSSAPTPPPRTPSVQHNRAESTTKSAAETKNQFQEQVKAQLEAQKAKEEEAKRAAKEKEDAAAKAVQDKEDAEKKAAQDKEDAEKKAAADKEAAEKKAAADKEAAEKKAAADKEAEAKAAADKEAADKEAAEKKAAEEKAAEEKAAADKQAAADKEASDKKAAEEAAKAAAEPAEREETEEERFEREIMEMEAAEKAEEERERAYAEKRAKEREEQAKKDAAKNDEDMKRAEREAEELELQREKEREAREKKPEAADADKDEAAKLFASLKKPTLGPGAEAASAPPSGTETPVSDAESRPAGAPKAKPTALKLDTNKPVEPAQPTAGMVSLKSARFLELKSDNPSYPDGFKSPNPALNQSGKRIGREYDMDFLLQFQGIFKEKPSVDWDQKVKDTLGDGEPASARPSAGGRTPSSMGGRQGSRGAGGNAFTAMGTFGNTRTLPPGTSSQDRFAASQAAQRGMPSGLGGFPGRPGGFPVGGAPQMSRTNSMQAMAPGSPKVGGSSRRGGGGGGGGGSRRGPSHRDHDRKEIEAAKAMPLTANMDLKPLEKSTTGWAPRSIGQSTQQPDPSGHMAPDMVQRKVKAALNKMTPENFERISDQIMAIADQSKNEKDGRTLRQVIQLTFEKACDEAHWAGTYAKFCSKMLHNMSNEIVDETIRDKNNNPVVGGGLFRKYLLNRCQEEFERGWEANLPEKPDGSTQEAALLSDEYYIAAAAKRRGLGLIQFIGELYKLGMLTVKIMHQCVLRLLNFEGQPDESAVENLSKLLKAVGATMDANEQGHQLVDMYYQRVQIILDTHKDMSSRSRFMLMDIVDLRKQGWKSKDTDKGPKTIEEIHAEAERAQAAAELERQKNASQRGGRPVMGRGDARSGFQQPGPPPDYQRNTVGMDDLRRLQNRTGNRQASSGLGPNLGPGGFMASRSSSGRKGLGPPRDGDSSGPSSRSGTPLNQKKEETNTHVNAFSALAGLDGSEDRAEVASPPSEAGSPPVTKAQPASIDAATSGPTPDHA